MIKATLSDLRHGVIFIFEGQKYISGDLLFNRNDCDDCVVSCKNITTGEKRYFTLETEVEVE